MNATEETSRWEPVKDLMAGAAPVTLGPMHAYHMARTPRRVLYTLSYYKFAAKMIGRGGHEGTKGPRDEGGEGQGPRAGGQAPRFEGQEAELPASALQGRPSRDANPASESSDLRSEIPNPKSEIRSPKSAANPQSAIRSPQSPTARVLDIGCGEGLGTWLLAAECGYAKGVDFDADLIAVAKKNWPIEKAEFTCEDVLTMRSGEFDAAVSFDVIEHILPANADAFLRGIAAQLTPFGLAIIGTPNVTSAPYASAVTNAGHVNLYDATRLEAEMRRHFHQVFMFGANDEVVHTGFAPMCQYLIAMGVRRLS